MSRLIASTARLRRRERSQRGAAAVEFAILLPVLSLILFGLLDFGIAFNTGRQLEDTLRSAARLGAGDGDRRGADFTIVRAIASQNGGSTVSGSSDRITKVVVYEASGDGTVPPACWEHSVAETEDDGVRCNLYPGSLLEDVQPAAFGLGEHDDPDACSATALDRFWCPVSRADASEMNHNLGVAVEVSRDPLLSEKLGVSRIQRHVVFRLEVRES